MIFGSGRGSDHPQTVDKRPRVGRHRRFGQVVVSFIVAGCAHLVYAAQAIQDMRRYLDQPVANIVILYGGAPLTGDELILSDLIGLKPGDRLRIPVVREAIKQLFKSGYASDVVVTAQGSPASMTLTFDITPVPTAGQVSFEGVSTDLVEELRRRIPSLDPATRVTQGLLNTSAERIVEYYHSLGYYDVSVSPETDHQAGGRRANVTFRVTPGPRFTVAQLELDGLIKVNQQDLESTLRLKPGTPFAAVLLQDDIDRLRRFHLAKGYLSPRIGSPQITLVRENSTVNVTIPVDSGPSVEIQVTGTSLSEKQMRSILPSLTSGGIDPAILEEGRLKLIEYLQRQGHFFADVTLAQVQQADDHASIIYQVDAGRKYSLKEIRIEGTDAISYEDVKNDLGSRLGGLLTRGLTSRELAEEDQRVITEVLHANGYLKARVEESRLSVGLNREDLIVMYVVDPGPRSRISDILFKGNEVFSDQELEPSITVAPGDPLSQPKVGESVARLASFYGSRGYAESSVTPRFDFTQPGDQDVSITFDISEGPQLRIHRLLFRGNTASKEPSLRKFLGVREGDLLVKEQLNQGEEELYATGAFRRILISTEPAGTGSDGVERRNVSVDVIESPKYVMTYGGGYRTDDGPRGLFDITNTNLIGRLYTGSFRVRASRREQLGQVSFTDPRPLGTRWPLLLSTYYQREDRDPYNSSRLTGLVQVERQLPDDSLLILRYSFSNVITSEISEDDPERRRDAPAKIGRLSASWLRDRRDSALDARRGTFTTFDVSLASQRLGGNENFIRFYAEHQRFVPLGGVRGLVFAGDARVGLSRPYGSSESITISERFFAGGSTTLRGFSFENAGPRGPKPGEPGQTQPLGGNALIILNAEMRFPIWNRLGLGGAIFYDTGNVFARISDISLKEFTHTVGFGIRINTPVGPIRVDFGVLAKHEPLVPRTRVHLSFGPPF